MPSSKTKVDSDFIKLGSEVYLRKPSVASDDGDSPNIILVFGWMGAKLRHLHKYTKVYEELYPGATQVLVLAHHHSSIPQKDEGNINLLNSFIPNCLSAKAVAPVVEILEALGAIPGMPSAILEKKKVPTSPRILIHSFSNGGAYCMMTLGKLLAARPMPSFESSSRGTCALILDSAPGGGGLHSANEAFTGHMRNPVGKFCAQVFISTLYILGYMVGPMIGRKTALQRIRDPSTPLISSRGWVSARRGCTCIPRVIQWYLGWTRKRMRALPRTWAECEDRRLRGFCACGSCQDHPVEYWDAVKSIWNEASQAEHSPFE
ncbi:hypothetical protein CPB85DRAFT_1455325 [Mucidula mucida]|nr:hypothetical protein CPB85DRAFT_1455325 [Mucidula mucida]